MSNTTPPGNTRATPPATPLACLLAFARETPEASALFSQGRAISYQQLGAGAARAAAWLHTQGVRHGDTVATLLEPVAGELLHQIELLYGIAWLGAVILPIYPGSAPAWRGQIVAHMGAAWLLAGELGAEGHHGDHPQLQSWQPANTPTSGASTLQVAVYSAWQAAHNRRAIDALQGPPNAAATLSDVTAPSTALDPAAPFMYEFSSGTMGSPKIVLHTGATYLASAAASARAQGWRQSDVLIAPALWPGKIGLRCVLRAHLIGAACVLEAVPTSRTALAELIRSTGLNVLQASPGQLRGLLATPAPQPTAPLAPARPARVMPYKLRLVCTTGAFIEPEEIARVAATFDAQVHWVYGATETGIVAHLASFNDAKPGDKLFLASAVQASACDAYGQPLPSGAPGRLRIRSPWSFTAYAHNPEASAAVFRDGWFYSDDYGAVSADGQLTLLGRMDDVINFGGVKVRPRDLEQALLSHPCIQDAAILAYPDKVAGEIPVAFVVFRQNVPMGELRAYLEQRLDRWHVPQGLVVTREIPRNGDGKPQRERLKEAYERLGRGQT